MKSGSVLCVEKKSFVEHEIGSKWALVNELSPMPVSRREAIQS